MTGGVYTTNMFKHEIDLAFERCKMNKNYSLCITFASRCDCESFMSYINSMRIDGVDFVDMRSRSIVFDNGSIIKASGIYEASLRGRRFNEIIFDDSIDQETRYHIYSMHVIPYSYDIKELVQDDVGGALDDFLGSFALV